MNKLTETDKAKEYLELCQRRMVYDESTHIIGSLLSLLEEKDKALQSAEWSIEHMLREQPNELWTEQECESWESFGRDSLKEIKAALTSSNNEGEI